MSVLPKIILISHLLYNGYPQITVRAARNISEGEHLSTMYTHALWGTIAR